MKISEIPSHVDGKRVIIGGGDTIPCEYLVGRSELRPGTLTFSALVEIEEHEADQIMCGARRLWLTFDGGEVPWSLEIAEHYQT